jgi:CRP-like cAMP-binding protein
MIRSPLFSSPGPWPASLPRPDVIDLPAKTILVRQGHAAATVYYVESGLVALTREGADDGILAGIRSAGALVGIGALVLRRPHSTTAVALSPLRVGSLTAGGLGNSWMHDPEVGRWLIAALAAEAEEHVSWLEGAASRSARSRLMALFETLFAKASELRRDGSRRLLIPETVEHLASSVRVTREQTSRTLSELAREGLVRRDAKGWFTIPASHVRGRK